MINKIDFVGNSGDLDELETCFREGGVEPKRNIMIHAQENYPMEDWLTIAGAKIKAAASAILAFLKTKADASASLEYNNEKTEITSRDSPDKVERILQKSTRFKIAFKIKKD